MFVRAYDIILQTRIGKAHHNADELLKNVAARILDLLNPSEGKEDDLAFVALEMTGAER